MVRLPSTQLDGWTRSRKPCFDLRVELPRNPAFAAREQQTRSHIFYIIFGKFMEAKVNLVNCACVLLGKFEIQYVDTPFHGNDLMYTEKEHSVKRTDSRTLVFMRALP